MACHIPLAEISQESVSVSDWVAVIYGGKTIRMAIFGLSHFGISQCTFVCQEDYRPTSH